MTGLFGLTHMSVAGDAGAAHRRPRVAVACDSRKRQKQLRAFFTRRGIDVVASEGIGAPMLLTLGPEQADVLLVDLASAEQTDSNGLHELLSQAKLPLLFNEAGMPEAGKEVGGERELLRKIESLARNFAVIPAKAPQQKPANGGRLAIGRRAVALVLAGRRVGVGTTVLGAGCLVLIAMIVWELGRGPNPHVGAPISTSGDVPHAVPAASAPPTPAPLSEYQEIVARPLFYSDRHLPQPQGQLSANSIAPELTLPNVRLNGVVIGANGRQALLRDLSNGQTIRAQPGTSIQGWTVGRIEAGQVILQGQGRAEAIPLWTYEDKPPPKGPSGDRARRPRSATPKRY
jgi:hypothetical protein